MYFERFTKKDGVFTKPYRILSATSEDLNAKLYINDS